MATLDDRPGIEDLNEMSVIWMTSLLDEKDNSDWDAKSALVKMIISFSACICEALDGGLAQCLSVFSEFDQGIFKRIEYHILGLHGTINDIDPILADNGNFENVLVKNEMANLFKRWFSLASGGTKAAVLDWIDSGPSDVQGEGGSRRVDHWKMCKLSWISDSVDESRRAEFDRLKLQFGPNALDLADRSHHMTSGWGQTSPFTVEELETLPLGEVVNKVNDWVAPPREDIHSPSIEGLAQTFGTFVAKDLEYWSKNAMLIAGMKRYYVSRAFSGWLTGVRDNRNVDWSGLMDLAEYILTLPVKGSDPAEAHDDSGPGTLDRDWKWTRQDIAELISKGCDRGVDIALRPRFLAALTKMIDDDPASSIVDSAEILKGDHATDALNSSRGKVASALCDLAVWTAKSDSEWKSDQAQFHGDVKRFADVQSLMEHHFQSASNANASAWAAYALRANQLLWLHPKWFQEVVVNRIALAHSTPDAMAPWAFWLTFLKFQNAHGVWLKTFRQSYEHTATWLAMLNGEQQTGIEAIGDYLEHLMVYFWQGELEIGPGSLIQLAFINAEPSKRMQAMTYVGQALKRSEESPPADIVRHFQSLWEWYWPTYGKADVETRKEDRHRQCLFGDWLASGFLGAEWSLKYFLDYLGKDDQSDHDEDEFKRLDLWCGDHPLNVLNITTLLVHGDREGWRTNMWKESIASILNKTKVLKDPHVEAARDCFLVALIKRGRLDFFSEA